MAKIISCRLSDVEYRALMKAISNMTDGNARDPAEIRRAGFSHQEAAALLRGEQRLEQAWKVASNI